MGKSNEKRFKREQERISKRLHIPTENPLKLGWTFNTWYEKVILVGLMVLGIWKFFELVFL